MARKHRLLVAHKLARTFRGPEMQHKSTISKEFRMVKTDLWFRPICFAKHGRGWACFAWSDFLSSLVLCQRPQKTEGVVVGI